VAERVDEPPAHTMLGLAEALMFWLQARLTVALVVPTRILLNVYAMQLMVKVPQHPKLILAEVPVETVLIVLLKMHRLGPDPMDHEKEVAGAGLAVTATARLLLTLKQELCWDTVNESCALNRIGNNNTANNKID
jgi:hypothetical protein